MTLHELPRADGKPAAVLDLRYTHEMGADVYGVEPDDGTHYTVVRSGCVATAWVGTPDYLENCAAKGKTVAVLSTGDRRVVGLANGGGCSGYDRAVLLFLCYSVLGYSREMPEGLVEYRAAARARGPQ